MRKGTETSRYIYNPVGDILLREEKTSGGSKSYCSYITDIRGSVKSLISDSGKRLINYSYDDYGNTDIKIAVDNNTRKGYNNHICYTGGIYDRITDNYYLNSRYYNPDMMRFITQDSYRGTADDSNTWNLYSYCAGNPIRYVDPSGHFVVEALSIVEDMLRVVGTAVVVVATYYTVKEVCQGIRETFFPTPAVSENSAAEEIGDVIASKPEAETPATSVPSKGKKKESLKQKTKNFLKNISDEKKKHIIEGSRGSNHHWEKLVPDKKRRYCSLSRIIRERLGYII